MKKITFMLLITTTLLSCKVQQLNAQETIIPVEDYITYTEEIPDNTYFKDVNNLFDEFVGTWEGSYDGKTYRFVITEITEQSNIRPLTFDKLMIKHKITDSSGTVISDTMNLSLSNPLIIFGRYFLQNGESYQVTYHGEEFECGDFGNIFVTVKNNNANPPELSVYFSQGHDTRDSSECLNDVTIPFPGDVNFTLIKQ